MEVVYGGAREGAFLCSHPLVRSIHLTGSAATYDAVVWGKAQKARARARRTPLCLSLPALEPSPNVPDEPACTRPPQASQHPPCSARCILLRTQQQLTCRRPCLQLRWRCRWCRML